MSRRGFAWYEMLMTLAAIGSITALSIPMYADFGRQEIATAVLDDVDSVRAGVFRFYSDSGYFPAQAGFTVVPENLAGYLPAGFSFRRSYGTLEYKNWPVSASYSDVSVSNVVGISVITRDPRIGAAAFARYRDKAKFSVGSNRMFIIFGG
jgi:hypothetical protein